MQHMDALRRANDVRTARAALRRRVATGGVTVGEVLADPPDYTATMTIGALLQYQQRWGEARSAALLDPLAVSTTMTIAAMTIRQRRAVVAALGQLAGEVAESLARQEASELQRVHGLCEALNGSGPCLRPAAHDGGCVIAAT